MISAQSVFGTFDSTHNIVTPDAVHCEITDALAIRPELFVQY